MVMDGHGNCDLHVYCDRGVHTVVAINGRSGMVTVTVTSMDTVTGGYKRWWPSMDGHSNCDVHGYCDSGTVGGGWWWPSMDGHVCGILHLVP